MRAGELIRGSSNACFSWLMSPLISFPALPLVSLLTSLMKCVIAESYTHIGQAQIDKGEVRDRASGEHNRKDEDHTGTPVRERELGIILELTWYTS